MSTHVKGILIDPPRLTVTPVYITNYSYRSIYKICGFDCFTLAGVRDKDNNQNGLFVDDEGLLNGTDFGFYCPFFYPEFLAGRGLILGCDEEGETIDTNLRVAEVVHGMQWVFAKDFDQETLPKEMKINIDFDNPEYWDGTVEEDKSA